MLAQRTILIVEPQDGRAAQYESLVRNLGQLPLLVRDGDAAIAQLQRVQPQILLTELGLPGSDGFAVLREARKLTSPPRVLVVSAFRELRDVAVQQRLELGIDALLASTSPLTSVDRALRRLLDPASAEPPARPSPQGLPSLASGRTASGAGLAGTPLARIATLTVRVPAEQAAQLKNSQTAPPALLQERKEPSLPADPNAELLTALHQDLARRMEENEQLRTAGANLHRAATDARAFLGAVVAASSEGLALFDSDRRLIAINEMLVQITGLPRELALTLELKTWLQALAPLMRDPQRFGWLIDGLPVGPFALREEIELVRPKPRTLRWTARPVRLASGEVGFVFAYAEVLVVPDLTDEVAEMPALD